VTLLSLLTLVARRRVTGIASKHLTILLLVSFAVFFWRDILPFGFLVMRPTDPMVWLTWVRGGILTVVALVLPSITPRVFKPVDASVSENHLVVQAFSLNITAETLPCEPRTDRIALIFYHFLFLGPLDIQGFSGCSSSL
jgi:hypothetical protein